MNHPSVAKLRHRAELPLLIFCMVLTVLVWITVLLAVLIYQITPADWTIPILFGAVSPFIAVLYLYRKHYAATVSNAVEMNDEIFPEVYKAYVELATRMGFGQGKGVMATIPKLYMTNGDGTLNAFASKCQVHKGYVCLNSDLLEIAYKQDDLDGILFVLAHELGHIKCGHVSAWRLMAHPIANALFLGQSLTRAQEWTADRCGYYYAPEGKESMMVLIAGKKLYKQVDFQAYMRSVRNHKLGFWLRLENFLASHAVGYRRMEAIEETKENGWDVHGKMLQGVDNY